MSRRTCSSLKYNREKVLTEKLVPSVCKHTCKGNLDVLNKSQVPVYLGNSCFPCALPFFFMMSSAGLVKIEGKIKREF